MQRARARIRRVVSLLRKQGDLARTRGRRGQWLVMGRSVGAARSRRKLRSPAARARSRQLAALRAWLRQRATIFAVVVVLLGPFCLPLMATGVRVAFGAPPNIT